MSLSLTIIHDDISSRDFRHRGAPTGHCNDSQSDKFGELNGVIADGSACSPHDNGLLFLDLSVEIVRQTTEDAHCGGSDAERESRGFFIGHGGWDVES